MAADQVGLPAGFTVDAPVSEPGAPAAAPKPPPGFTVDAPAAGPSFLEALKTDPRSREAVGLGEAGMNLVTGLGVGFPAYLVRGGLGAMFGEEERQEEATRSAQAGTYEPRTERGKAITEAMNLPFQKLMEKSTELGQKVTDKTGSPVLGALTEATIQMAPAAVMPAIRGGAKLARRAVAPTPTEFQNAGTVIDGKAPDPGTPSPTVAKLERIYEETGAQPAEVIRAALQDTNTMADLVADNRDVPAALKAEKEAQPETPPAEERPGAASEPSEVSAPEAAPAREPPVARPEHAGDTVEMPPPELLERPQTTPQGAASLTVVRHGETQLNNQNLVRGWIDVPLNERGSAQARELAQTLKTKGLDVIVTSDLERARSTAQEISRETGKPLVEDPALRPWNVGEYSGKPNDVVAPVLEDYAKNKPDQPLPGGGESFNQFKDRYLAGVERISAQYPGKRVALVSHHRGDRLLDAWNELGMPASHQVHMPTFLDWEAGIKTGTHLEMDAPPPRAAAVIDGELAAGKSFERDVRAQIDYLNREARVRGFPDAEAMVKEQPEQFGTLAAKWRELHEGAGRALEIPRAAALKPEQRVVETKAIDQVQGDLEGQLKAYEKLPDSDHGKIINTDIARELFPDYREARYIHSPSVHEPASAVVKELFTRKLSEPDPTGLNMVTFTAGGTGAGKTTALGAVQLASHVVEASQIVYDTNMAAYRSAVAKVDLALQHGKQANIIYIGADPVDALERALKRAMRTGRTVPLDEHAKTHEGSARTIEAMMKHYEGNDRVQFIILDNGSGAKGEVRVVDLKDAPAYLRSLDFKNLPERLKEKLDAEFKAGRISEEVYRGTAATISEGARGAPGEGGAAEPRAGEGAGGGEPAAEPGAFADLAELPRKEQPQAMAERIAQHMQQMGADEQTSADAASAWREWLTSASEKRDIPPAELFDRVSFQELARDPDLPPELRSALSQLRPFAEPPSPTYAPLAERGGPPRPPQSPPPDPAQQAVLERISQDPAPKRRYTWEAFYADVKDDLWPIKRLTDALRAGEELGTAEDPYKLARLTRGAYGKAEQFLEYSPFNFKTYKNVGKSMREIIEPVKDDLDGLRAYAVARRAVELAERKIETGVPLEAAREVIAKGAKYEGVLRELQAYQNHLVDYLKDAGILKGEAIEAMRAANKDYVPFFRLMDDAEGAGGGAGAGLKTRQPIKRIRGSERLIIDPLESIVKNTYLYTTLAERNAVGEALIALVERSGRDDLVKRITPPVKPIRVQDEEVRRFLEENGVEAPEEFSEALTIFRRGNLTPAEDQIVVFREGKRELYQVPPEVATAFKATDRETAGMLMRVLAIPAKLLRVGATLSPDFISRNPVRDQFSAYVLSKSGYVPILDMVRGAMSIVKHDSDFQDWLKSGGANAALVSLDRDYVQQELARRSQQLDFLDKAWNVVKNPLEPLRIASELMENATRLGEFKKAAEGMGTKEAILSAGYQAREVTIDFARLGARTRSMNLITAFWNANLEGVDRVVRAFGERPFQTTAKIAASITLPSVLLWWANHDDDWVDPQGRHHNRWKELPNWERDLFWIVLTKDHIYRIPKPFELGVLFGSTVERLLDKFIDDRPDAAKDLWSSVMNTMGINLIPTTAAPILGQIVNWNFFTDRPLIPASQERLLPEYQYSSYTTQTTRALAHLIGMIPGLHDKSMASPQVIDNYIRSWSGTLGNYALQIADAALRKTGVVPDPVRPAKTLEDLPVLRGFMVRFPTAQAQSIQDFYDSYEKSTKVIDTIKYLAQSGDPRGALAEMRLDQEKMLRIESVHQALAKSQQVLQLIDKNPRLDEQQKKQLIDTTYYQMIAMARMGNQELREMQQVLKKVKPAEVVH